MDEVLDFFKKDKPLKRKVIPGGTTSGRIALDESISNQWKNQQPSTSHKNDVVPNTSQYAEQHRLENQQELMNRFNDLSVDECINNDESNCDEIYSKYEFIQPSTIYPITQYKTRILNAVKTNPIVVLEGPTACGKTTQVPQFILDEAYRENVHCNIVIAQPRRIAAASNAERVANERNWPLGTVVGYQIGFDEKKHLSTDTRILYCTTGILLEKLIRAKHFNNYTHIILDEVHERNKDMDFLFVVIKKLFVSVRPKPKIKIIIMSATIQANRFSVYFSFPQRNIMQTAPIITIQHQSKFKVEEFFLKDFYNIAPQFFKDLPSTLELCQTNLIIPDFLYKTALYLINHFDSIDESDLVDRSKRDERPTVLIFLPGIHEIAQMETILKDLWTSVNAKRTQIEIIVLHSTSDSQQRKLVFRKTSPRTRKIILATNIAESSITVPDVKYILDFCRTRIMMTDSETNFSTLQLTWASRCSCIQRAGRTGRIMNGRCYRFIDKNFYYKHLPENPVPELISSPLENVILKAKLLEMGSPHTVLALAMDHPDLDDIAKSILLLKEIGALLRTCNNEWNDFDGDISFIGRIMANLPLDVKIAKFIILGYCFSVLDECIIIGAALNARCIFRDDYRNKNNMNLYSHLLRWANGSGSDLFAMLHAYNTWAYAHSRSQFGVATNHKERERMKDAERHWAHKFCLDIDALQECHTQINEIKYRLERINIKSEQGVNAVQWNDNEKSVILKVVIAGAFYPNIFERSSLNSENYSNTAFRDIGTRDPRNTIYFSGFDRDRIRDLYKKSIKNIFIQNGIVPQELERNIKVNFDCGSNKVFVTFKNDDDLIHKFNNGVELMPGNVCTEVYKSLKMRELHIPMKIQIMKTRSDEMKYVDDNEINIDDFSHQRKKHNINLTAFCLPKILDVKMRGMITNLDKSQAEFDSFQIESCSRFWFRTNDEFKRVNEFETYVQRNYKTIIEPVTRSEQLINDKMMIAKIGKCDGATYHRAVIMSAKRTDKVCRVRLVDTGKILDCNIQDIFVYCDTARNFFDLPPRCFKCRLAQIQPSHVRNADGLWPSEAIFLFNNLTTQKIIDIEVYSVTNGLVNVFVKHPDTQENFNAILIQKQFGEFVEEDYISTYNHLMRSDYQLQQNSANEFNNIIDPMYNEYLTEEYAIEVEPPPIEQCQSKLILKGPYSSLSIETHGLTEATRIGNVMIDKNSVNSVMIENEPQDITAKYLVAATACVTSSKTIKLQYTTQMPNIRGFGPLMALIFCPTMQVKCNHEKTHYTVIRTGLGYDVNKQQPIFCEHDIIFHLGVEFTQHDIELINQIRYCLDTLLLTYPGQIEARHLNERTRREILLKIKNVIVELLEKTRQSITPDYSEFLWDPTFANLPDFVSSHANDIYGNRAIFPLHCTLKTHNQLDTDREFMYLHCNQLHDLTEIVTTLTTAVLCRLCNTRLENISTLKLHLLSRLHCDNEKRINFKR